MDQGPERDYTPDEDGRVVHYGPGDRPLCGSESMPAVYTDEPALVSGCRECLELAAENLDDDNEYRGHRVYWDVPVCKGRTVESGQRPLTPHLLTGKFRFQGHYQ